MDLNIQNGLHIFLILSILIPHRCCLRRICLGWMITSTNTWFMPKHQPYIYIAIIFYFNYIVAQLGLYARVLTQHILPLEFSASQNSTKMILSGLNFIILLISGQSF